MAKNPARVLYIFLLQHRLWSKWNPSGKSRSGRSNPKASLSVKVNREKYADKARLTSISGTSTLIAVRSVARQILHKIVNRNQ